MENDDENRPPKPQTPKIHKSSPFSSSPLQLIRNFASLSNRGSPSSPLGRLFGKVNIQKFDILLQNFKNSSNWNNPYFDCCDLTSFVSDVKKLLQYMQNCLHESFKCVTAENLQVWTVWIVAWRQLLDYSSSIWYMMIDICNVNISFSVVSKSDQS